MKNIIFSIYTKIIYWFPLHKSFFTVFPQLSFLKIWRNAGWISYLLAPLLVTNLPTDMQQKFISINLGEKMAGFK